MSLTTVAIIASVLWIGAFIFYMRTAQHHSRIEAQLDEVREMLEERERLHQR
ncbi:MAG: hypothetical protein ACPG8W_08240 [Candidatus Promineifilaceae bacterium]